MIRVALSVSLALGSLAAQDVPTGLSGATIYHGDGAKTVDASIVMHRGEIIDLGPRASTKGPEGTTWIDVTGKFITPGLIDTHVHYSQTGWVDGRPDARDERETYPYWQTIADCEAHPERFHQAFLLSGVTAVFDVGGYPFTRRLGDTTESSSDAPHVVATGALLATWVPDILSVADRSQFVLIDEEARARAAVRSHAAAGSDAIKVWFVVRDPGQIPELERYVRAAADEARQAGLPLVVHATSLETARIAVDAGAHLLVHSVEDKPVDEAFVAAIADRGTFYCPTLTVRDGYHSVYAGVVPDHIRAQLEFVHDSVEQRILATEELGPVRGFDNPRRAEAVAAMRERQLTVMATNIQALRDAGVPIVMGTDAGNPMTLHGPSVFIEMEAMQAAGLSASEVLVASTRDAARAIGRGDDIGLLGAGRIADLLVLDEDPGEDIARMRTITHVCRNGVVRDRAALAFR